MPSGPCIPPTRFSTPCAGLYAGGVERVGLFVACPRAQGTCASASCISWMWVPPHTRNPPRRGAALCHMRRTQCAGGVAAHGRDLHNQGLQPQQHHICDRGDGSGRAGERGAGQGGGRQGGGGEGGDERQWTQTGLSLVPSRLAGRAGAAALGLRACCMYAPRQVKAKAWQQGVMRCMHACTQQRLQRPLCSKAKRGNQPLVCPPCDYIWWTCNHLHEITR